LLDDEDVGGNNDTVATEMGELERVSCDGISSRPAFHTHEALQLLAFVKKTFIISVVRKAASEHFSTLIATSSSHSATKGTQEPLAVQYSASSNKYVRYSRISTFAKASFNALI
jgi:hypothetical protein